MQVICGKRAECIEIRRERLLTEIRNKNVQAAVRKVPPSQEYLFDKTQLHPSIQSLGESQTWLKTPSYVTSKRAFQRKRTTTPTPSTSKYSYNKASTSSGKSFQSSRYKSNSYWNNGPHKGNFKKGSFNSKSVDSFRKKQNVKWQSINPIFFGGSTFPLFGQVEISRSFSKCPETHFRLTDVKDFLQGGDWMTRIHLSQAFCHVHSRISPLSPSPRLRQGTSSDDELALRPFICSLFFCNNNELSCGFPSCEWYEDSRLPRRLSACLSGQEQAQQTDYLGHTVPTIPWLENQFQEVCSSSLPRTTISGHPLKHEGKLHVTSNQKDSQDNRISEKYSSKGILNTKTDSMPTRPAQLCKFRHPERLSSFSTPAQIFLPIQQTQTSTPITNNFSNKTRIDLVAEIRKPVIPVAQRTNCELFDNRCSRLRMGCSGQLRLSWLTLVYIKWTSWIN